MTSRGMMVGSKSGHWLTAKILPRAKCQGLRRTAPFCEVLLLEQSTMWVEAQIVVTFPRSS